MLRVFLLLALNFEFTKTARESFLADCCLAPTPSHTPLGACLNFAGCGCLWGAVAVCKWLANVQLGVVFVFFEFSTNLAHCSSSKWRCRPPWRKRRRSIWITQLIRAGPAKALPEWLIGYVCPAQQYVFRCEFLKWCWPFTTNQLKNLPLFLTFCPGDIIDTTVRKNA